MTYQRFYRAILATLLCTACNYSKIKSGSDTANELLLSEAMNSDQTPSFAFVRDQILARNNTCNQCHVWATSYAGVMNYVIPGNALGSPLIKKLQNSGGNMPKNAPPLSAEALAVLSLWIDSGATEFPVQRQQGSPGPIDYPENPTFADIKKYVLSTNCTSCHRADSDSKAHNFPFQNYDAILQQSSDDGTPVLTPGSLEKSAMWDDISAKDMPPEKAIASGNATALTDGQIQLVKRWIEQGAVNESPGPLPRPTPTPTPSPVPADSGAPGSSGNQPVPVGSAPAGTAPTFQDVSAKVFQVNCTTCHNSDTSTSKAKKIPLTSYQEVMLYANPKFKLVVPGDPGASAIWDDINKSDMPPEKAIAKGTVPALTDEQKDIVKQWILSGALEK